MRATYGCFDLCTVGAIWMPLAGLFRIRHANNLVRLHQFALQVPHKDAKARIRERRFCNNSQEFDVCPALKSEPKKLEVLTAEINETRDRGRHE